MKVCCIIHFICCLVLNDLNNIDILLLGRGMKSGDNFKILYDLAEKFNAAGM